MVVSDINRDYIIRLAREGNRVDGRKLDEYRQINIEAGLIKAAEGTASVKIGDTNVLVGIKMAPGEPYPDTPDRAVLMTSTELIPMASPLYEAGPPRANAIELARVVDRGIREGEAVDLKKLCITEGEQVWVLFIDIHVLDYDGNLIDASALGALAALTNTIVPASKFELGDDFKLPINSYPVACTSVKIGDIVLVDPNLDEDETADARLTVTTDGEGDIRAMQKGLSGSFTIAEVKAIIKTAGIKAKELRALVK